MEDSSLTHQSHYLHHTVLMVEHVDLAVVSDATVRSCFLSAD